MSSQETNHVNGENTNSNSNSTTENKTEGKEMETNNPSQKENPAVKAGSKEQKSARAKEKTEYAFSSYLKVMDLDNAEIDSLISIITDTRKRIKELKDQKKSLKEEIKPVSRVSKKFGIQASTMQPEQRRVNRVKINRINANLAILKKALNEQQKALKEKTDQDTKDTKFQTIRIYAQDSRYISQNRTFLSKKFTKAFQDILDKEYPGVTKADLMELRKISEQEKELIKAEFDPALVKMFSKMDFELEALYAHDLKMPLRQAILESLKNWNPEKDTKFPELDFPKEKAEANEEKKKSEENEVVENLKEKHETTSSQSDLSIDEGSDSLDNNEAIVSAENPRKQ